MERTSRFSGSFYPDDPAEIIEFINGCAVREEKIYPMAGCVLPHAGWFFSGRTALNTLRAASGFSGVRLCVIFGAVHTRAMARPALSPADGWETPLGTAPVDTAVAAELADSGLFDVSASAHEDEHSIEVLLPFVRHLAPDCLILPVSVPYYIQDDLEKYVSVFSKIAQKEGTFFIASSDFTHYGPRYGDLSYGSGEAAHSRVKEEKDKLFINLVRSGEYGRIIPYAVKHASACGAGGIALLTGILKGHEVRVMDYTTSCDVYPQGGCGSFVTYCGLGYIRNQASP